MFFEIKLDSIFALLDGNPLDNLVTLYVTLRQGLSPVVWAEVYSIVESGSYNFTLNYTDNGAGG